MIQSLKNTGNYLCENAQMMPIGQVIGFLSAHAITKLKIINLNPLAIAVSFAAFHTFHICSFTWLHNFFNIRDQSAMDESIPLKFFAFIIPILASTSAAATYVSTSSLTQRNLIGINVAILSIAITLKIIAPKKNEAGKVKN